LLILLRYEKGMNDVRTRFRKTEHEFFERAENRARTSSPYSINLLIASQLPPARQRLMRV
jgi:hypothetical protein